MYQQIILASLKRKGRADIDPRWIEGYMRLEHGTLDGLAGWQFEKEIKIGVACVDEGGTEAAESNAKSYGL